MSEGEIVGSIIRQNTTRLDKFGGDMRRMKDDHADSLQEFGADIQEVRSNIKNFSQRLDDLDAKWNKLVSSSLEPTVKSIKATAGQQKTVYDALCNKDTYGYTCSDIQEGNLNLNLNWDISKDDFDALTDKVCSLDGKKYLEKNDFDCFAEPTIRDISYDPTKPILGPQGQRVVEGFKKIPR